MDAASGGEGVTEIDVTRLKELIPHRYPFLLIDKIIDVIPDDSAVGVKNVTINEPFFQGHFPERPVMPGVLIIECMAQTAAALVVHTLGAEAEGKLVYFMTVDEGRFRRPVAPGDTLMVRVKKERSRRNVYRFKGVAKVADTVVAEAAFSAMIMDS